MTDQLHASQRQKLTELRLRLMQNGYPPVPVTSPGAAVPEGVNAGKAVILKNWTHVCAATPDDKIAAWSTDHPDWGNTGILTGSVVGIDIDVMNRDVTCQIEALAAEQFGTSPLRRFDHAPKVLLVYRCDATFSKKATDTFFFGDGVKAQMEILGAGQQFVAFGRHPDTGRDYAWADASPLNVPLQGIPAVSAEQIDHFLGAVARLLREVGAVSRKDAVQRDRDGRRGQGLGTGDKPSADLLTKALEYVPNDDITYDNWLRVGFALHDGLGSEGAYVWENWSACSSKNDPGTTRLKWDSFGNSHPHPITVSTLFYLAKQNGWGSGTTDARAEKLEGSSSEKPQKQKQSDLLIELANRWGLFHTPDRVAYADVDINGHRETWPIRGSGFKSLLRHACYQDTGGAVGSEAFNSALAVIEAQAIFDGAERPVFVRIGQYEAKIYLDLGNADWNAAEIDAAGWRIINNPPARFIRAPGMLPLPTPAADGEISLLRNLLNIGSDDDFVLAVAWSTATLLPRGPYPLLAISGEQGSAKSSFARIMRALVDPNAAALRSWPREERDLFVATGNSHVLAYDNVSKIVPWLSDALCRISTGGAYAVRRNYSDREEELFEAQRPIILNGIAEVIEKPDLAEQSLFLTLAPILEESRRTERELKDDFDAAAPQILGALLDGVATGLKYEDDIVLDGRPRMADFAHRSCAAERAFWDEPLFMAAYSANRADAERDNLEADPVAVAVERLIDANPTWSGTATDLLGQLISLTDEKVRLDNSWPTTARGMAAAVRRAATGLRRRGVDITESRFGKGRSRTFAIARVKSFQETASASSALSASPGKPAPGGGFFNSGWRTERLQADARQDDAVSASICPEAQESANTDAADAADDKNGETSGTEWEVML